MNKKLKITLALGVATLLFTGCGGGGSGGTTTSTGGEQTAYLIDSAVEGIDYTCGTTTSTTDSSGKFTYDASKCPNGVEFKLGNLSLGTINPSAINSDTYLTIQELAGTTRNDVTNATVQKLAVLLQSLDSDNDPNNGILITQNIKNAITLDGNLADKTDNEITTEITKPAIGKTKKELYSALNHLLEYTKKKDSTVTATMPDSILASTVVSFGNGLQWQDDANNGDDYQVGLWTIQTSKSWTGANQYCENLSLAGQTDWRLPTYEELNTIVDMSREGELKIKSDFKYVNESYPLYFIVKIIDGQHTWDSHQLSTKDGYIPLNMKTQVGEDNGAYVRCVRGTYLQPA